MDVLIWLIPVALGLGLLGLIAFLWALKSGQFDDLDGAAHRILFDDDPQASSAGRGEADSPAAARDAAEGEKTRGPERG